MSSSLQTFVALGIVAVAFSWLLIRALKKRKQPGCGNEACSAVSPELKKLQAKLHKR